MKNWLIRVTVNGCKNVFRAKWRTDDNLDEYASQLGFESRDQTDLFVAVNSLDQKYRIVIHLYYFEGYSTYEIAQILRTTENTVSTRLRRARGKLKQLLTEV